MKKTLEDLLIIQIKNKNIAEAKALIEKGADIHYLNDLPLALSASLGLDELFHYLIDNKANALAMKSRSLKISAQKGNIDLVDYLINQGLNKKIAQENGNERTISFLIKKELKEKLEKKLHSLPDLPFEIEKIKKI